MSLRKTGGLLAGPHLPALRHTTWDGSMSTTVKIVATLTARPGKAEELKALLFAMVAPSRAEPGNLRWDIWRDQTEPGRFVLDELYTDNDAVAAHRATAHFETYLGRIADLAERNALVLDAVNVD
jgi:quinol monooxygenase YgiN